MDFFLYIVYYYIEKIKIYGGNFMSKTLKITLILIFLFCLYFNISLATDINMNTIGNQVYSNNTQDLNNTNNHNSDNITSINTYTTSYASQTPATVSISDLPEADLGLANILNIILIVLGILLVLISIAILIRLK